MVTARVICRSAPARSWMPALRAAMADSVNNSSRSGRETPTATSTSLLQRMQCGDVEAWQRLVDLYAPLIYYWCHQSGLRDEDAGDVVQEVFKSVVTSLTSSV